MLTEPQLHVDHDAEDYYVDMPEVVSLVQLERLEAQLEAEGLELMDHDECEYEPLDEGGVRVACVKVA